MKKNMLNEAKIIAFMQKRFPKFIGDDAAILPLSRRESYVITKDILVEDVHFRRCYCDPVSLAEKSLHVNLSDIAAMGAKPKYVMLGVSIPNNCEIYINKFFKSFANSCKACGVVLVGGDTTASFDKLFVSGSVIGIAKNSNLKYRSQARQGDVICVAGYLGYAHVGLEALEKGVVGLDRFKKVFLKPKARLDEGIWFGRTSSITSMMDISDGLYVDLKKLCQASKVGAEINLDQIEISPEFAFGCQLLGMNPKIVRLVGGEDYGLLVTVKKVDYVSLACKFQKYFGYKLKVIGKITTKKGITLKEKQIPINLNLLTFSHFGEKTS